MDPGKVLLDDVSGTLAPGFTALMGPSGAGKTTLLCALALRLDNATLEGQLLANGETYTRRDLKQLSGFVTQDDVLPPNLTVREALAFSAALLMPADWGAPARAARVAEVIAESASRARPTRSSAAPRAAGSRAASASARASRSSCSRARGCSSSTSRPPASTRRPRSRSARCCAI
jgi:ABC-type Fe3+/spermidine/putrescine transport system ATPase subunit